MKHKLYAVASVSILGTLLGCAQLMSGALLADSAALPSRMPVKVAAVSTVTPAMPSHEALYTMGRAAHGAGQLLLAAQHYAQVLERAPDHVGALNALAVIYAQSDRIDEALELFARALRLAPGAAHVHNNTGYALLRAGRLDEAEGALKLAQELDPSSVQTQQNLKLLANAQAELQPSVQMAQLLPIAPSGAQGVTTPRLVAVAPNVYALQVSTMPVPGPVPVLMAGADLRSIRLEVSNGAGSHQLARRTADRLATLGVATARLTNAQPYRQAVTEIQFVAAQCLSAQSLQSRLPVAARMVLASRLESGVQLRLVLGHDVVGKVMAAWLDATERQVASAARGGGWLWS